MSKSSCKCTKIQEHVHEFQGSVMIGNPPGQLTLAHNHRFAGISGEAIPYNSSHVHLICTRTDFFISHFHCIYVLTGPAIPVYDENNNIVGHVHGFSGTTSTDVEHNHNFKGATLIENPIDSVND